MEGRTRYQGPGKMEKIGKLGTKDPVRWPYTNANHRSGHRHVLIVRKSTAPGSIGPGAQGNLIEISER